MLSDTRNLILAHSKAGKMDPKLQKNFLESLSHSHKLYQYRKMANGKKKFFRIPNKYYEKFRKRLLRLCCEHSNPEDCDCDE